MLLVAAGLGVPAVAKAQSCARANTGRIGLIVGGYAAAEAVAIALQHDSWWSTPSSGFHFASLPTPSKGQDYLLHATASYQASQLGRAAWRWACVPPRTAAWLGALLGVAVALPKEIGDGLHEDKGFSLLDMAWSTGGAVLPAARELWPGARMLALKVNYWPSAEYRNRSADQPTLPTDYAGQRYFLALDPGRLPDGAGPWPDWLGVAMGHSVPHWATVPPIHQWYVTLDLDLQGLPIRSAWWSRVAAVLDQVKLPMPGVRIESGRVSLGFY